MTKPEPSEFDLRCAAFWSAGRCRPADDPEELLEQIIEWRARLQLRHIAGVLSSMVCVAEMLTTGIAHAIREVGQESGPWRVLGSGGTGKVLPAAPRKSAQSRLKAARAGRRRALHRTQTVCAKKTGNRP